MRTSIERQRPTSQPRFPHTAVRLGFFMAALAGLVLFQPSAAFAESVTAHDLYSLLMLGSSSDSGSELELAGMGRRDTIERALNTPSHGLSKLEDPRITGRPGSPTVGKDHPMPLPEITRPHRPTPDITKPHRPTPGGKQVNAVPEPTAGLLFAAGTLLVTSRLRRR